MEKVKHSKWWLVMGDILDKNFPKKECKERGRALVMLAEIEYLLLYGEEKLRKDFKL